MLRKRGGLRRRRVGRGLRKRGLGRRSIARPFAMRKKFQGVKYFTEIFDAGVLSSGGGIFVCALNSMINSSQYFNLFDLGTITRFDVMLVPMNGDTVYGTSPQTGRITWCSTQNTNVSTPGAEITLLQQSDAKVLPLDGKRTITLRCYRPKAQIQGVTPASAVLPFVPKRSGWDWLDTNSLSGQSTAFVGIPYYVTSPNPDTTYKLLIKVYAAFKEQQ